jgi:hypothetical protein
VVSAYFEAGPTKNRVFGAVGAGQPVGFILGLVLGAASSELPLIVDGADDDLRRWHTLRLVGDVESHLLHSSRTVDFVLCSRYHFVPSR